MRHFSKENLGLALPRNLQRGKSWDYTFVTYNISDLHLLSILNVAYIFPLYLYPDQQEGKLFDDDVHEVDRISNFTPDFLHAVKESIGSELAPEEIFCYVYAVLYSPTYRKRYEEFLKIDFPRVPLSSDLEVFKELGDLGKELVDLHLLKNSVLDETEIGFPKGGSNNVEKVFYDKEKHRVFINREQYFEAVSEEVWEYRIGAYQVMDKYLKDRKKRKLSLDEINHYMKVAKAIRLTIELQERIDDLYRRSQI